MIQYLEPGDWISMIWGAGKREFVVLETSKGHTFLSCEKWKFGRWFTNHEIEKRWLTFLGKGRRRWFSRKLKWKK